LSYQDLVGEGMGNAPAGTPAPSYQIQMSQGMAVERDNTGEIRNQSNDDNGLQWLSRFP
jgi:hypothetical protein